MDNNLELKYKIIGFIITIIILIVGYFLLFGGNKENTSKKDIKEPTQIELMSYTQTVLEKNLINAKYSRNTKDYNFINTGLRYKIEGKVNNEKFWMIIEFTDKTYKTYDLVSLQVGEKKIY